MSLMELLRMSVSNLRRRKLRTFLTVLGVVIGTASIVVMISLGLGMQQAIYQEIESYGGMTTIQVYGADTGDGGMMMYGGEQQEESEEYVNDAFIKKLGKMDHIVSADPVYTMSGLLLRGSYEGYVEIMALKPDALQARNIKLSQGTLPKERGGQLEFVYGNQVITSFTEKGTGSSYWETGELPDIDLGKDPMFLILDQESYYAAQEQDPMASVPETGAEGEDASSAPKSAQKHVVRASGMVEGGLDDYSSNAYYAFCDLDTLKQTLKKEFSGRVIPGQPQTKNGKPLKDFCYSYAQVKVDEAENVAMVTNQIKEMGYNVQTNEEYMESMEKQMAIIQAVLGGIGAVSLFVAAIGIANTMMMSIYERTKEIGVMKVLGCSIKNICEMFLMEAAFIGVIGGVIGNILSFIMSFAINIVTSQSSMINTNGADISYIPVWLTLASIGFAIFVGVAAGFFPARRAMRLSPLEAIRNN